MGNPATILCYGDSNTYGYDPRTSGRYPKQLRWTTLLQEQLGAGFEVIPEGLNGRTTAFDRLGGAWKNGVTHLPPCLGTHKPLDVVVLMLGTNDCTTEYRFPAQRIAEGMQELIDTTRSICEQTQEHQPRIIIVAPAAIREDYQNSPFAGDISTEAVQKSRDLGPLYEELAKRNDCLFLDGTESLEVSPCDSMHLTEKGHRQLAETLRPLVLQAVAD